MPVILSWTAESSWYACFGFPELSSFLALSSNWASWAKTPGDANAATMAKHAIPQTRARACIWRFPCSCLLNAARLPVPARARKRHKPMLFLLIPCGNDGFSAFRSAIIPLDPTREAVMNDAVLRADSGAIAVLTLNRPAKYNALSREVLQRLHAELDAIAADTA